MCYVPSSWALRCVLWEIFLKVFGSGQSDVRSGTSMPLCCVVNAMILYTLIHWIIPNTAHAQTVDYLRVGRAMFCHAILITRIPWLNPSMFPFTTQHVVIVPERTSDFPEEKLSKHPDNGGKDIRGMGYILVQWVSNKLVPVFARQKSMDSKKPIETTRNCRN